MNVTARQLRFRSDRLKGLCVAGLFSITVFAYAGDVNFMSVGTIESHQAIWSKRVEIDQAITESPKTIATAEKQIIQLRGELEKLKGQLTDTISLTKDEFETTAEWRSRLSETNKLYHATVLREINRHEAKINALQNQIDNQNRIQKAAKEQIIGLSSEVMFFIPVEMDIYDAETGTVKGFELENPSEIKGHPSLLVLRIGYGEKYFFEYDGIKKFAGMRVEREKARIMREASNSHELWARFTAHPLPLKFAYEYYETNVTHTKVTSSGGMKIGGVETDGPKTVATRLLVSLLGGNPGSIGNLDTPKTTTYTSDDWIKAKIIRTGWKGEPKLESFYRFDRQTGRLQPIE